MVLPEYGRNIQKMVDHVKTVEDRDERNRLAKAIIQIMGNMNPHLRDVADFTHKLWDHLAIISNFELDVDSPYPAPEIEKLYEKPEKVPYKNADDVRFKHYGRVLENMIKRAASYDEGEEKNYLIEVIANHMKKSYIQWNRENISDDLIFSDLVYLSGNNITIPEGLKLKEVRELQSKKRDNTGGGGRKQQNKGGGSHKGRGSHSGGHRDNRDKRRR